MNGTSVCRFVVCGLLVAGCARRETPAAGAPAEKPAANAPSSIHGDVERLGLAEAETALADAVRGLDRAVELASPDCPLARSLRDRICELSAHICRLAGASPGTVDRRICDDATARCARGRERVSAECP